MQAFQALARLFGVTLCVPQVTVAASGATSAPLADGFSGIWYEITQGAPGFPNKYGGGFATYPQQHTPIAVYAEQVHRTYFVYGGASPTTGRLQHMISYYDHKTGMVARPRVWLDNNNSTDAHDNPTLAIDGAGYIYMFSNTHGNNLRSYIRRSDAPFSIDGFDGLLSVDNNADVAVFGKQARFSYAQPWYVPHYNAFALLHTRYDTEAGLTDRNLYTTTSLDADQWTTKTPFAAASRGHYQISWLKGDGRTLGTAFNVHPASSKNGSGSDARTNLYYAESDDLTASWRTADGLTLNTPIITEATPALIYDYKAEGKNVYLKDLAYDRDGRPIILYLTSGGASPSADNGPRTLHTAHYDGSAWAITDVLVTDHNYDHGSLYIEDTDEGDQVWRIIGAFLPGPQAGATGGSIGSWSSTDRGATWVLDAELTPDATRNHTYPRRPLHAHEDFYALWADGDALNPSTSSLFFSDAAGNVYRLPELFPDGQMYARPILTAVIPEPASAALLAVGGLTLLARRCRGS